MALYIECGNPPKLYACLHWGNYTVTNPTLVSLALLKVILCGNLL